MSVILQGTTVAVVGSYIRVPHLEISESIEYADTNCMTNFTLLDFKCLLVPENPLNSTIFRMQVLFLVQGILTVGTGVIVDSPIVEGKYIMS